MRRSVSFSSNPWRKAWALRTVKSLRAAMDSPPTVTARLSGLSRFPPQAGQATLDI